MKDRQSPAVQIGCAGEGMGHATIRDVAQAAAVSVASASRALSGHPSVRPSTRERIRAAARALDYVPHAGARSLSLARTNAIGVVLPDLHGEFFSEVVRGMDREAHRLGYQLLLSNMHAAPSEAAAALRALHGRVDGLVVMAPGLSPDVLAATLSRAAPAVLVNSRAADGGNVLNVANVAAAEAMTVHLQQAAGPRVVHLAGPHGNKDADERRAGYEAAMTAAGATPRVIAGNFDEATGAAAARQILAQGLDVDAVFAANDMMAIGCLLALREAGVDVPGRIAIGGFDDIPAARYVSPGLTTMRVDMAGLGARAVRRVVSRLDPAVTDDMSAVLVPQLIVRATTRATPQ